VVKIFISFKQNHDFLWIKTFGYFLEILAEFVVFGHLSHSAIWTSAFSIFTKMGGSKILVPKIKNGDTDQVLNNVHFKQKY
jgi:hypothetical protein